MTTDTKIQTVTPKKPVKKHAPMSSLVAAATRISGADVEAIQTKRNRAASSMSGAASDDRVWQNQAWNMYDLVGEQRFITDTLAGRSSKARLFIGEVDPDAITNDPKETDRKDLIHILASFGRSQSGREQIIKRLTTNLIVAGDGWLVGVSPSLIAELDRDQEDAFDMEWGMLSVDEVEFPKDNRKQVTLKLPCMTNQASFTVDEIVLMRHWDPHPRFWERAQSPTKASLPVLNELVGLTMHISAQIKSRLAGAGILIVPQGAYETFAVAQEDGEESTTNPLVEALLEAMITPINDRESAAALVPMVVTVPDSLTDSFKHITFSTPLDQEARQMRDEAIRRLALGQDCPPELLLGTAGMNHWGGWLVKEDVVSTHLEPRLALICDALTVQYLWPMLVDHMGMTFKEARKFVVWYDVSHLITRPNLSADALELHSRGVISDSTLRDVLGFDDDTKELEDQAAASVVGIALELVKTTPALMVDPGIEFLINELRKVLGGQVVQDLEPLGLAPVPDEVVAVQDLEGDQSDNAGGPAAIPQTSADGPSVGASPGVPVAVGV